LDTKVLLVVAAAVLALAALIFLVPGPAPEPQVAAHEVSVAPALVPVLITTPQTESATNQPMSVAQVEEPRPASAVQPSVAPARRVIATYFHNTTRCVTCRSIEQRARETMESAFAEDLASGRLVWRALNMELKENEHYTDDYRLTSPSLVFSLMDGEREVRFVVLQDTWTLIHRAAQFETYIIAETLGFLQEL
jgi:hypothetical protein